VLWASVLTLAAVLVSLPGWALRGAGALLLLAAVLAGPGMKLLDTLVTARPGVVGEVERGALERVSQVELPWRIGALRISPAGTRAAVLTREAPRAAEHVLVVGPEGGRVDIEARDLRFVDESNALVVVESETRTMLEHRGAAAGHTECDVPQRLRVGRGRLRRRRRGVRRSRRSDRQPEPEPISMARRRQRERRRRGRRASPGRPRLPRDPRRDDAGRPAVGDVDLRSRRPTADARVAR